MSMEANSEFVIELWSLIEEYIPKSEKEQMAISLLKHLEEYGTDLSSLDFASESKFLQRALNDLVEDFGDDDDEKEYDE